MSGRPAPNSDRELSVVRVGDVADRVVDRVQDAMQKNDVACERPHFMRVLSEAASEAARRGASISVIRQGFIVRKATKAEIVLFEQADVGVLDRALQRVAPLESDLDL